MGKRISDPQYTAAVIGPHHLAFVCRFAESERIDTAAWFSGLGLTREMLDQPALRLSYRQAREVILRALAAMPRPGLGLSIGQRETAGVLGAVGQVMMSCRTFGDAIEAFLQHHLQTGSLVNPAVELRGDQVALIAQPRFEDPELLPYLCEEFFSSALMIARSLVGERLAPRSIELTYAPPSHVALYEAVARCPLRFGFPRNQAFFDARWLEFVLPGAQPATAQAALTALERQPGGEAPLTDIVATLGAWLRERVDGDPTLAQAAAMLHMSARTLRRRLADAGTSYQALHDGLRRERASALLAEGRLSIAAVGAAVGFSDAREFRRAFKRWTGAAPRERHPS